MQQDLREAPQSFFVKQEYESRMKLMREKQEREFNERKARNAHYAEETTEKLLNMYYHQKREILRKKAEVRDGFYVPKEAEFFAVILIRSRRGCPPKPKKVLQLLRLKRTNACVFIRNNKSMKRMLQIAKDYIAFGTIDMELLRRLLYFRGSARNGDSRVKLTNEFIEDTFCGKLKCIEELAHHIYNGTELFKEVNKFLYPFHLNSPQGGFSGKKSRNFNEGGSAGDHQDLLWKLLEKMI